ncbi:MAG: hypothetical protein IPK15_27125 [Verrucomicrobia bacterium]|nr:hypothetical protein [Verrucomicrobiota bacterium]
MNSRLKTRRALMTALAGAILAGDGTLLPVIAGIPEPGPGVYGKQVDGLGRRGGARDDGHAQLANRTRDLVKRPDQSWDASLTPNINDQFSYALRVACETPEAGVTGSSNTVFLTAPATSYRRATVSLDGQPPSLIRVSRINLHFTPVGRGGRANRFVARVLSRGHRWRWLGRCLEQQYFCGFPAPPLLDPRWRWLINPARTRGTKPK